MRMNALLERIDTNHYHLVNEKGELERESRAQTQERKVSKQIASLKRRETALDNQADLAIAFPSFHSCGYNNRRKQQRIRDDRTCLVIVLVVIVVGCEQTTTIMPRRVLSLCYSFFVLPFLVVASPLQKGESRVSVY